MYAVFKENLFHFKHNNLETLTVSVDSDTLIHLDFNFDAGCDRCHARGRICLLNPEHLVVLLAGLIPHNSMHLLIITADFVALYRFYWICAFHYSSIPFGLPPQPETGSETILRPYREKEEVTTKNVLKLIFVSSR